MTFILGLDLGQTNDSTALAVLQQSLRPRPDRPAEQETHYACLHMQRWFLGTPYPEIVRDVCGIVRRPPLLDPMLVIDRTGVGRPIYDLFAEAQPRAWLRSIVITGGHTVSEVEDGSLHVPKKELVSTLQALFAARRFVIAKGCPEGDVLAKEIGTFKVKMTAAANETFGAWRDGQHDDLVLAVALACWMGEHGNAAWDGSLGLAEDVRAGASIVTQAPSGVFNEPEAFDRYQPDEERERHRGIP
jgi:hypothetical protein